MAYLPLRDIVFKVLVCHSLTPFISVNVENSIEDGIAHNP